MPFAYPSDKRPLSSDTTSPDHRLRNLKTISRMPFIPSSGLRPNFNQSLTNEGLPQPPIAPPRPNPQTAANTDEIPEPVPSKADTSTVSNSAEYLRHGGDLAYDDSGRRPSAVRRDSGTRSRRNSQTAEDLPSPAGSRRGSFGSRRNSRSGVEKSGVLSRRGSKSEGKDALVGVRRKLRADEWPGPEHMHHIDPHEGNERMRKMHGWAMYDSFLEGPE
ncbi:hypothetical protein BJ508DRAFT_360208 [Ascobolus immersus RN42]|uniref:Uncharacterized protein n=1 Tax=Ascobolus immersus RN42 TaxID=1160509 RepID=A0A3N4IE75_ASCIM|nr:hypothetical protein BJ508DRAFT_360208 [Ascobolus immersus RN42]